MNFFSKIVYCALLVTTPILTAYPTANHQPIQISDLRTLSYDEIVDLLSKIELDAFSQRYSTDELDQINQFISSLSMEGMTDDEKFEIESAMLLLYLESMASSMPY